MRTGRGWSECIWINLWKRILWGFFLRFLSHSSGIKKEMIDHNEKKSLNFVIFKLKNKMENKLRVCEAYGSSEGPLSSWMMSCGKRTLGFLVLQLGFSVPDPPAVSYVILDNSLNIGDFHTFICSYFDLSWEKWR